MLPLPMLVNRATGVEQRRHPRHLRRLTVELAGARLHTTNVALGGMQVEIPALRYAGLCAVLGASVPEWRLVLPGQPLPLIVTAVGEPLMSVNATLTGVVPSTPFQTPGWPAAAP